MKLITNKYEIKSNKIDKSIKIYHFTDLHAHIDIKKDLYKRIIDSIYNENPDYVCFTGDMIDSIKHNNIDSINILLSFIKKICLKYKLIYINGNHEIMENGIDNSLIKNYLKSLKKIDNLYFLDGNFIEFDDITFYGFNVGFDYYYEYKEENNELINNLVNNYKLSNKFNCLLFHSPSIIDSIDKKFDLMLFGHMHNGIIPHFLNNKKHNFGLISPRGKLFPKYSRNMVNKNNIISIIGYPINFSKLVNKYKIEFLFRSGINIININKI